MFLLEKVLVLCKFVSVSICLIFLVQLLSTVHVYKIHPALLIIQHCSIEIHPSILTLCTIHSCSSIASAAFSVRSTQCVQSDIYHTMCTTVHIIHVDTLCVLHNTRCHHIYHQYSINDQKVSFETLNNT